MTVRLLRPPRYSAACSGVRNLSATVFMFTPPFLTYVHCEKFNNLAARGAQRTCVSSGTAEHCSRSHAPARGAPAWHHHCFKRYSGTLQQIHTHLPQSAQRTCVSSGTAEHCERIPRTCTGVHSVHVFQAVQRNTAADPTHLHEVHSVHVFQAVQRNTAADPTHLHEVHSVHVFQALQRNTAAL